MGPFWLVNSEFLDFPLSPLNHFEHVLDVPRANEKCVSRSLGSDRKASSFSAAEG